MTTNPLRSIRRAGPPPCMILAIAWLAALPAITGARAEEAPVLPEEIPLWPGEPPLAPAPDLSLERNIGSSDQPVLTDITRPSMRIFPAPDPDPRKPAVIVFPGGGYQCLVIEREGFHIARWLNRHGITAAVVKYRVSQDQTLPYRFPIQLTDARRAIRLLRARADAIGIDPSRIGVIGFSAGGHLAASVATLLAPDESPADTELAAVSARPDFAVLVYPVISMGGIGHAGSRANLLGPEPGEARVKALSLENRVTPDTPPVFIVHGANDRVVDPMNSIRFHEACLKAGVDSELHVFRDGPHGFTLGEAGGGVGLWPGLLIEWLRGGRYLSAAEADHQ